MVRDETRKSAALKRADGIVTGFDMFDEAEVAKQNNRAARFGTAAARDADSRANRPRTKRRRRRALPSSVSSTNSRTHPVRPNIIHTQKHEQLPSV